MNKALAEKFAIENDLDIAEVIDLFRGREEEADE